MSTGKVSRQKTERHPFRNAAKVLIFLQPQTVVRRICAIPTCGAAFVVSGKAMCRTLLEGATFSFLQHQRTNHSTFSIQKPTFPFLFPRKSATRGRGSRDLRARVADKLREKNGNVGLWNEKLPLRARCERGGFPYPSNQEKGLHRA